MKLYFPLISLMSLLFVANQGLSQAHIARISPSAAGIEQILVTTGPGQTGEISIKTASKAGTCAESGTAIPLVPPVSVNASATTVVNVPRSALKIGGYVCASVGTVDPSPEVIFDPGCRNVGPYTDCTFDYMLIGGIEQSDLSAKDTVTEGFYDLFIRRPVDSDWGSLWFRSRFLGTPGSSSTQNVVAAAIDPSGTLTTSGLAQSVASIDYVVGFQLDLLNKLAKNSGNHRMTYSPIVGFGATSPLSSTTTVLGLKVPDYGTEECNQLQQRFGTAQGYNPALPGTGVYDAAEHIGCVVQPNSDHTQPGTQITTIAFSNEDRSSFLLKWGAGLRIIDRYSPNCNETGGCSRLMADFTLGKDQSLTGGSFKSTVFKADAIIPVMSTGFYFFGSSATRITPNKTLPPLILTPVTIVSGSGTCPTDSSGATACVPSPNVFVLPYRQQDRDFYRIGIGIDIAKVFKIFNRPAEATN
jgi:hypothetical protein